MYLKCVQKVRNSVKLAIIGSRTITHFSIDSYIPDGVTEIVTGGARGVDALAKNFAERKSIRLTEFKPDYRRYKKGAPLMRNRLIADYADEALVFWDGRSKGTKYTRDLFLKMNKNVRVVSVEMPKDK